MGWGNADPIKVPQHCVKWQSAEVTIDSKAWFFIWEVLPLRFDEQIWQNWNVLDEATLTPLWHCNILPNDNWQDQLKVEATIRRSEWHKAEVIFSKVNEKLRQWLAENLGFYKSGSLFSIWWKNLMKLKCNGCINTDHIIVQQHCVEWQFAEATILRKCWFWIKAILFLDFMMKLKCVGWGNTDPIIVPQHSEEWHLAEAAFRKSDLLSWSRICQK